MSDPTPADEFAEWFIAQLAALSAPTNTTDDNIEETQ